MNKKRLLKLADLLDADAKRKDGIKFDLGDWGFVENENEVASCGTYACAVGLAAVSGAFKRQGLGYRLRPHMFSPRKRIEITLNGRCRDGRRHVGSFLNAIRFFDLTAEEGEFLFVPKAYGYNTPTHANGERLVAKRIRDFVAGTAKP